MTFLTPAQFESWKRKNDKPHASYLGYKTYVTKTRAARAAAQGPSVMPTFQGLLTPAQIAQAKNSVNTQIDTSLAGFRAATKAEQEQSNRQAERAQSYAMALGNLTKNDPSQIADQYRASADRMKAYGTGLSGAALEAQQADSSAVADRMKAVGLEKAPGSYDLQGLRNTALTLGTIIPGESMEQEAARAFSTAESARQGGIHQVGDIAQQYLAKTTDAQAALAAKRAELEAQRPQLIQSALSSASDNQRQQRALDVQIGTLQLQNAKSLQDQAVAYTNLTGSLHVVRNGKVVDTGGRAAGSDAAKVAGQNSRAAADRRVKQEIADASNRTKLTVANTQAAAKKAAAAVSKSGNKPATPKQRSDIIKNANAQANALMKTTMDRIQALVPRLAPQGKNESDSDYAARHKLGLTVYRQRLQEHRNEIITRVATLIEPQLTMLKYGPDQINSMAASIVNAYIPKGKVTP
jgi:vacuolar-type H+-ATPase subunit H